MAGTRTLILRHAQMYCEWKETLGFTPDDDLDAKIYGSKKNLISHQIVTAICSALASYTSGTHLLINLQSALRNRKHVWLFCQTRFSRIKCFAAGALRTLERAGDTEGGTGWRWSVTEDAPDTAKCQESLLLQILSSNFTDDTRGALDSVDPVIQNESSTEPAPGDALHSIPHVRIGLRRSPQHHAGQH